MPFEVVYTRYVDLSQGMAVRSVVNITDSLKNAFMLAIGRIEELKNARTAGISPHTLQIWENGRLLALARVYRPKRADCPLHVNWVRTPTEDQIQSWEVDLDCLTAFPDAFFEIREIAPEERAAYILRDLLLTKDYAAPTTETFKVLYEVEREMGTRLGIATHLEDDLGL